MLAPLPARAEIAVTPIFKPVVVYYLDSTDRDNSFVDSAAIGVKRAKLELDIDTTEYRIPKKGNTTDALEKLADEGYSPIIAIGNQNVLPVQNIAESHPKTRFIVIDGLVPPLYPNVQSISFRDHEGSFLMGYIAAISSKTNHLGFVGGMNIPLIRNFALGYEQGAKYANPNIRVDTDYIGTTSQAWSNPEQGFELARKQYENGADVVFAAAGGSSIGVLKAAQIYDKLAIGVDTNQNGMYPGHVLTSLVKRVDIAVYQTLKSCKANTWQPDIVMLGLREGALDYAIDQHNRELIDEKMLEKIANIKERIMNGIINVSSYSMR